MNNKCAPRSTGAWGALDADCGFRSTVMAAAMVRRQGSVSCRHLQQMADQVAEGSAFQVRPLLQALVQLRALAI